MSMSPVADTRLPAKPLHHVPDLASSKRLTSWRPDRAEQRTTPATPVHGPESHPRANLSARLRIYADSARALPLASQNPHSARLEVNVGHPEI